MENVAAFEAKTHFSSLLERVAKGERFIITRHGKPIAQLVPMAQRDPARVEAAITRMREISTGLTLDGDWREIRDAGRKW
jgi:prevent-host-death family protein